jgi:hypothetical protein
VFVAAPILDAEDPISKSKSSLVTASFADPEPFPTILRLPEAFATPTEVLVKSGLKFPSKDPSPVEAAAPKNFEFASEVPTKVVGAAADATPTEDAVTPAPLEPLASP